MDDEVKGKGNSYGYEARMYDSRVGRWLSRDPLEAKYTDLSPYNFVANMPIIAIDPDGRDVIIVVYNTEDGRYKQAAWTRVREIKAMGWFDSSKDKVILMGVRDMGKLKPMVDYQLSDAVKKKYGKTKEFSYYGHTGKEDGPRGELGTTGDYFDKKIPRQLSVDGWMAIDFNFKEKNSIANFYGCESQKFAQKFALFQDAAYTSGFTSTSGPSSEPTEMNKTIFNTDYMYMLDENVVGLNVFKGRSPGGDWEFDGPDDYEGVYVPHDPSTSEYWFLHYQNEKPAEVSSGTFSTNLWVDSNGKLHGYKI